MKRDNSLAMILFVLNSLIIVSLIWASSQNPVVLPEEETWTFAVFCDTRGDNENTSGKTCVNDSTTRAIANAVVEDGCDLVLFPGDMVNGWCQNGSTNYTTQFKNWKDAMAPVYEAGIEVYPVRGNHEDGSLPFPNPPYPYDPSPDPALKEAYIEAFKGNLSEYGLKDSGPEGEEYLTYSFVHNNAFFVGLDEYAEPHVHRVDQKWLNAQLANNSQPYVFVFGHEPAFKLNHSDCLDTYPEDRDVFWNSIGDAGCGVYFCGHDHSYDRMCVKDKGGHEIRQMVIGSCGAPMKPWTLSGYNESRGIVCEHHNGDDFGYALVTVGRDEATVEWKAWDGTGDPTWVTKDDFTVSSGDASATAATATATA
jgi:hypothetical protein